MGFDARTAKLLAPGEHITLSDHPGLRLEATDIQRSWIYRYKSPVDGKMRQFKFGEWPALPYPKAVLEWESLRARRNSGEDVAVAKREMRVIAKANAEAVKQAEVARAYTVARLCDDYWTGHIEHHRAKKGATEIRRLFDRELGDFATITATQVTRAQAFDLIQKMAEIKPVIAGQMRLELGAAWDYAIDSGRIPEETPNWWRKILRGKLRSKGKRIAGEHIGTSKRVLTEPEIGVLIRWLPNLSQLLQDVLILILWTACRGGEVTRIEGREVVEESDGWWWIIPKSKTKNIRRENATDLRVPLCGRALDIVLRRRDRFGNGFLFPSQNGALPHVEPKTIQSTLFVYQPYSEVRPSVKRPIIPVTHWAPHDLRRTARTLLAALGCPDSVAEAILGHMLPGVLGIYNLHSYDRERREWLSKLSDHLEMLATRHP